jgi:hypothetical protein
MMRGYFVQKRKHLHITTSTTGCKSQTSESHKSKFSPERDIHSYLFITSGPQPAPQKIPDEETIVVQVLYMPPSEFGF